VTAAVHETLQQLDDGRVAQRHVNGDPGAFGTLVDRYQSRLLTFVNRTIGDRERADDVVQAIFIRVSRHLHRFDRTESFSTWIHGIASKVANAELSGRRRRVA
jgi:RNA polymerase sigma-70 factor (ECF subfamily)